MTDLAHGGEVGKQGGGVGVRLDNEGEEEEEGGGETRQRGGGGGEGVV